MTGDDRRAIERLLEVVRSDPSDMRSRLQLGDLYARVADTPSALQMYEEAGRYYPSSPTSAGPGSLSCAK